MRSLLTAVLLFAVAMSLHADKVYRWVDAKGGVHYSATPPPGQAVDAEDLHFQHTPSGAAALPATGANPAKEQQDGSKEPEAAKPAANAAQNDEDRLRNCETAREIIKRIQSSPPTTRYQREDGSYQPYTPEELDKRLEEARAAESEFCD